MRSLTLSLLLACLAPAAWAQANCLDQVKFPAEGRWAEYHATFKEKPYTIRYGVIGQEKRGGKTLQWVEMRMEGENKDRNMTYQVLVPGSLVDLAEIQEIVFKPGTRPAMKMSGQMVQMIRGELEKQSVYGEMCNGVSLVGKEKVTVPAGTIEALHYHSDERASDSWLSPKVSFSLVKSAGKDYLIELVKEGEGAKSSITEKPQEMRGMGHP